MITIEHRIFNLVCERFRQHFAGSVPYGPSVLNPVLVAIPEGQSIADLPEITGTFTGTYPRAFELSILNDDTCHIEEVTLFADLGTSAPSPLSVDVTFDGGIPFAITGTGLSVTITTGAIGAEWLVRAGLAYVSIDSVYEHPLDYYGLPAPSLAVYATGNTSEALILEKIQSTMDLDILLTVPKEQVEAGLHLEILGDIRDCINRDPKLWDGTTCLAENLRYQGDTYFEQTDRGNSIFICNVQVTYRTNIKNARVK